MQLLRSCGAGTRPALGASGASLRARHTVQQGEGPAAVRRRVDVQSRNSQSAPPGHGRGAAPHTPGAWATGLKSAGESPRAQLGAPPEPRRGGLGERAHATFCATSLLDAAGIAL